MSKLEILRGDLVDVLYEATRDDVEYRFDTRVSQLESDDAAAAVAGNTSLAKLQAAQPRFVRRTYQALDS